jgi:phage head maturation protease
MNRSFLAGHVKVLDGSSPTGEFEVVLSAPTLDRDGEIIDAGAFDPLPDHITFDVDHGMSTATTVGSGVPRYEDGRLLVRGTFASIPRAQEVRALVGEGHIRSTSVAFMAPKIEVRNGVRHIVRAELLNGAFVAVPSNRHAMVLAAKTAGARPGAKTVAGSYEERREYLAQAIAEANPEAWWTAIVATFADSVVYEVEGRDDVARFEASYEIGDEGVTLTDVRPVDVVEVVQPAETGTDEDPEGAAATAAADPPASLTRARTLTQLAEAQAALA